MSWNLNDHSYLNNSNIEVMSEVGHWFSIDSIMQIILNNIAYVVKYPNCLKKFAFFLKISFCISVYCGSSLNFPDIEYTVINKLANSPTKIEKAVIKEFRISALKLEVLSETHILIPIKIHFSRPNQYFGKEICPVDIFVY